MLPDVRFGSWLCQNSSTRRRRRNILKESHIRESKILHTTMFDALMENCFFYISRMYEFLHRLGQERTSPVTKPMSALLPKADIRSARNEYELLSIGFAKRARVGAQQSATLG